MKPTPVKYRRLKNQSLAMFSRRSLWAGPDHLLLVANYLVGEQYRRFYFADVQAIVWRETKARELRTGILGGIALLLAILAALLHNVASYWVMGAVLLLVLMVGLDWALGPTCRCFIKTAVQYAHAPSLSRMRQVGRAIEDLRPLILEAQGQIPIPRQESTPPPPPVEKPNF